MPEYRMLLNYFPFSNFDNCICKSAISFRWDSMNSLDIFELECDLAMPLFQALISLFAR